MPTRAAEEEGEEQRHKAGHAAPRFATRWQTNRAEARGTQRQHRSCRALGRPRAASRNPCRRASEADEGEGVAEDEDVGEGEEMGHLQLLWLLAFTACIIA